MSHGRVAQVLVTLTPEGTLQAELPGANGSRRRVPMRASEVAETLLRMLQAQLVSRVAIGEDGAPTQQQVWHWERHQAFQNAQCPFCIAEGFAPSGATRRNVVVLAEHGGVVVRRVARNARGPKAKGEPRVVGKAKRGAREMGL